MILWNQQKTSVCISENKAVGIMKPGHCFTIEPMINEGKVRKSQSTLLLILRMMMIQLESVEVTRKTIKLHKQCRYR